MSSMEESGARILDVNEFYEIMTSHLEADFGSRSPFWVRGEIQKVYEKGHLYLDVVDVRGAAVNGRGTRAAVLKAHCWQSKWTTIRRTLVEQGLELGTGSVVHFFGHVDLYAPSATLGFTVLDIDVGSMLGEAAKKREALIEQLRAQGLFATNKVRPLSEVPLRIGLVASKGTEGYNDFLQQIMRSGIGFEVTHVQATVQGENAPREIVAALRTLDERDIDVICVVRGGGSRGDLSCFDDERIARTIAGAHHPVMTGIGHTGDTSIADMVAFYSAITPTELGAALATQVITWRDQKVRQSGQSIARRVDALLEESTYYVGERRRTMIFAVRDRLSSEARHLGHVRDVLSSASRFVLDAETQHLRSARRLLGAYDPQRRLAQGWALVSKDDGHSVKSLADVQRGDHLLVRVSDGVFGVVVSEGDSDGE